MRASCLSFNLQINLIHWKFKFKIEDDKKKNFLGLGNFSVKDYKLDLFMWLCLCSVKDFKICVAIFVFFFCLTPAAWRQDSAFCFFFGTEARS